MSPSGDTEGDTLSPERLEALAAEVSELLQAAAKRLLAPDAPKPIRTARKPVTQRIGD